MKRIFTILILGLFIIECNYGQDFKKIDYQIDFGVSLTIPYKKTIEIWPDIENHPKTDYGSNLGYYLEFLISYNFKKKYAINSGLYYKYTSIKINDKIGYIENKGNLTSSYLNLPILIKYRFSNKIPVSISAGPYLGFMIRANEKGTSYIDTAGFTFEEPDPIIQTIEPIQTYDKDIKKDYTLIDFGLSVKIDYDFRLSKQLTGIILTRFDYGLKDVMTNDLVNNNIASNWKNYNILLGLGIRL